MKKIYAIFVLSFVLFQASAQQDADTLWKFNGVTTLNFSQMALSNWAAGGENSVAGNAIVNLVANYTSVDSKVTWNNELLMGFGLLQQGDDPVRKSDDKIDFASKFGYKAGGNWSY